jgi:hypothetical protein
MILLDTNLLTRMTRSHDPQSGVARGAIQTLLARAERLTVVPQRDAKRCQDHFSPMKSRKGS